MAVESFETEVLADGPIGFWRLGERPGETAARDVSPNTPARPNPNDGTYQGGVHLGQPGFHGGDTAALFDGAMAYVRIPNHPSLNPTNITMEAKVCWYGRTLTPAGAPYTQRILEKESYGGTTNYGLTVQPDGFVCVELRIRSSSAPPIYARGTSSRPIVVGAETHIVATYDGRVVKIYLDGVLDSVTGPGPFSANPCAAPGVNYDGEIDPSRAASTHPENDLAIGDRIAHYVDPVRFTTTRTFWGVIDEVALYGHALPATRVLAHYEAQFSESVVFEYAVKLLCGKSGGKIVAPGSYFTAINVHNPGEKAVALRAKLAVALPGLRPGPVSKFVDAKLGPDQALEIDCPDIVKHFDCAEIVKHTRSKDVLKGFIVIQSQSELDVVGVYTAAGGEGHVETLHIERVPARELQARPESARCVDFRSLPLGGGPNPWTQQGVVGTVYDHAGQQQPSTIVMTTGAVPMTGMNCGFRTEIVLPGSAVAVEVTLARFAQPPTVEALDASGSVVGSATMSAPQDQAETIALGGQAIERIVITSPNDEVLLLQICYRLA